MGLKANRFGDGCSRLRYLVLVIEGQILHDALAEIMALFLLSIFAGLV